MYHPKHVLCSASFPSLTRFLREIGLSCLRGFDVCSGLNSVRMTNRATLFARSIQFPSSTVMAMLLLMKPSIDASVALMSNDRGPLLNDSFPNVVYHPLGVRFFVVS